MKPFNGYKNFKYKFGQNFLKNEKALLELIEILQPNNDDNILEIGPGTGVITDYLLEPAGNVTLVEIDSELVNLLSEKYVNYLEKNKLEIWNKDILQVNREEIKKNNINKVVGALPYNISKKIIEILLDPPLENVTKYMFILQKEVAHKYAGLGNKGSFLNHIYSIWYDIYLIRDIEKSHFYPEPKVDSSIILFKPKPKTVLAKSELTGYKKFLKNTYRNPRKKLQKNLKSIYRDVNWEVIFTELQLSELTRVEELDKNKLIEIYNAWCEKKTNN